MTSGCENPNPTRLTCEYDQTPSTYLEAEWILNNTNSWEELPDDIKRNMNETERNVTRRMFRRVYENGNLTRYEEMPEREKNLFVRLINNESTVGPFDNSISVSEVNGSTVDYLTERKYFLYQSDVYHCGTAREP
ncbi:MAG: hypothetical protein U5J64_07815 [Halobacteriales archaeon]|nr:hypothetical protein [Halobacteriales archaeon]